MSDVRTDASPAGALSGPRAFPEGDLSVQPDGDPKILAHADLALGSMQESPPPPPHATIAATGVVRDWLEPPPPSPPSSPRPAQSATSDGRSGASLSGAPSGSRALPEGHLSAQPDGGTRIRASADHAPGSTQEPSPPPPQSSPGLSSHALLPASCWIASCSARFHDDCFRLVRAIQDRFETFLEDGWSSDDANSLAENSAHLRRVYPHLYCIRDRWYLGYPAL